MGDWKNHCEVLHVPENASAAEIKRAFRKLALRFHPDRNAGSTQAKETFLRINNSYKYLMANLESRPRATPPPPPPRAEAAGATSAPPPPPPRYRKESVGTPAAPRTFTARALGWWNRQPGLRKIPQKREALLQAFPAFTAALAAMISLFAILRSVPPPPDEVARQPAAATTRARIASCELLSFHAGNLVAHWKGTTRSAECSTSCEDWIARYADHDSTCTWDHLDFRRYTGLRTEEAITALVPPPPPAPSSYWPSNQGSPRRAPGLRDDGLVDDPAPDAHPTFVLDSLPDSVTKDTPVFVKKVFANTTDVLEFDFVPKVWVGDQRVFQVQEGEHPRQIRIKMLRSETSDIVITDQADQAVRKIVYNVEAHR